METKERKRIRELEERVSLLETQMRKTRGRYIGDGKCSAFNAYIDGSGENKGTRLEGVEKVFLPGMAVDWTGEGYEAGAVVRMEFRSLKDAAAVIGRPGEQRRLEIREAVQKYDQFHGQSYMMDVRFAGLERAPVEREKQAAVRAAFKVDSYTATVDGERLWEIGASAGEV